MICSFCGISYSNKNEETTIIHNKGDGPHKLSYKNRHKNI